MPEIKNTHLHRVRMMGTVLHLQSKKWSSNILLVSLGVMGSDDKSVKRAASMTINKERAMTRNINFMWHCDVTYQIGQLIIDIENLKFKVTTQCIKNTWNSLWMKPMDQYTRYILLGIFPLFPTSWPPCEGSVGWGWELCKHTKNGYHGLSLWSYLPA